MPRAPKPFFTRRRNDSKTFLFSINETSGLPRRVCLDWQRRSFQDFPASLAQYRMPKNKSAADAGVIALIQYLKNETETVNAPHVRTDEIAVGAWLEKFTSMDTSPRTARNAARNRPYSPDTLETYKCFYDVHIKDDPIAKLKMKDIEDQDVLEFSNRMSLRKKKQRPARGNPWVGPGLMPVLLCLSA